MALRLQRRDQRMHRLPAGVVEVVDTGRRAQGHGVGQDLLGADQLIAGGTRRVAQMHRQLPAMIGRKPLHRIKLLGGGACAHVSQRAAHPQRARGQPLVDQIKDLLHLR